MEKILEDFLRFEADEDLFQRQYKGVHYWQTIRLIIADTVDKAFIRPVYVGKKKNKEWLIEKIHMFINAIYDIRNWHRLKSADILYFDKCAYRNVSGKKVDPYFGYFGFEKSYSVQRCFYLNKGKGKRYAGQGVGTAIAELKSYFIMFFSKMVPFVFDDKEKKFIYGLCDKINSRFKVRIDPSQVLCGAQRAFIFYNIYHRYYKRLLKRVNPRAIFVVCYYDNHNLWPLYPAAKEMGIPVIELEHGAVINHISYNYMDTSDIGKQLPDYLFTYGEFWDSQIRLPVCMKAYPIGNPFLENRYEHYAGSKMDDKKIVIYSNTWEQNGERLMEFALSILNKYHPEGYKVFFKMHPSEYSDWKEKYVKLKNEMRITVLTDEVELYRLLSMAKHHIGVFSTVLFEAVMFDVNIYILNPEIEFLLGGVRPLIDSKRAYLIHNLSEFEQFMEQGKVEYKDLKNTVWKKNACRNAHEMLEKIIVKDRRYYQKKDKLLM